MLIGIEKAAEALKEAETPIISDVARLLRTNGRIDYIPLEDIAAARLTGTGVGGVAGGVGGGLAGLLGHYVLADDNKRQLKDYLKSVLLGGSLGAGAGALGLGWAGGRLGEEMRAQSMASPGTRRNYTPEELQGGER